MAWCSPTPPLRSGKPPHGRVHRKPGEPISHHIQGRNSRHHKHLSPILVITKSPKFSRTRKESETKEENPTTNVRGIFWEEFISRESVPWEERGELWVRPRANTRAAKCPFSEPVPGLRTSHRSQGQQSSDPQDHRGAQRHRRKTEPGDEDEEAHTYGHGPGQERTKNRQQSRGAE